MIARSAFSCSHNRTETEYTQAEELTPRRGVHLNRLASMTRIVVCYWTEQPRSRTNPPHPKFGMKHILPFLVVLFVVAGLALRGQAEPAKAAEQTAPAEAAAAPNPELAEYFEKHVRPLLAKHCYECHSADSEQSGELALDTLEGLKTGGSRGPLFSPEQPEKSLFLHAISYKDDELLMPPEGKLAAKELAVFEQWVKLGAVTPEYKGPLRDQSKLDLEKARQFWSFRPLQQVTPPSLSDDQAAQWVRRPLDAFIWQQLREHKLQPSGEADRRTLIRRVTFDLTGLPPSYDEVQAFIADESPDAYERLVDRLLASPHYGERWARHWLDLARYSDTLEQWLNSSAQAWLYRDWVVAAFNRNLPYDEFVRLQLAADMLPDTLPKDLAALGFLGLSPSYWKELRLAPEIIETVVAEEWEERIDAVSRTFLGLTIACARCHDHKFDPITTEDYYGLAGVFASTQLEDRPLLPPAEAQVVIEAKAKVDALKKKLETVKDKSSSEAQQWKKEMESIEQSTPNFSEPWANVVREASIYVVADGDEFTKLEYRENQPRDLPVFRRGNPSNPGPIVPRRYPAVLSDGTPEPFQKGSGRAELAEQLLTDSQGLTARVFVNRIWGQHFGAGLVRTPSNFGVQGDPPTHPELLEYLAAKFVRQGWDIKGLHREMVLSATYRQSSDFTAAGDQADPENRLLWRMSRRRLEVEMWRDSMLAVAGNLDPTIGGNCLPLQSPTNFRRTLYAQIARRDLDPLLRLYDFPEPTSHSPRRLPTTTPLQQLYVLNGPFIMNQASVIASNLPEADDAKVAACYRQLFARDPSEQEKQLAMQFVNASEGTPTQRWQRYVHALLGLNEFIFVD